MSSFTIGQLAAAEGVSVETVRFYQRRGLLEVPDRRGAGYRRYTERDRERLAFIRRAKELGFTLAEIAELLAPAEPRTAENVAHAAAAKLEEVDAKLRELMSLRCRLRQLLRVCAHGDTTERAALQLVRTVAEHGRDLLRDYHPASDPPWHLHIRQGPHRCDQDLRRRLERTLRTIHLDQNRRRHPDQSPPAEDFKHATLASLLPVLVEFTADWCPPCRMIVPVLQKIADDEASRLRVVSVDVDANPVTTRAYGVMSMPTLALFADGRPVVQFVGAKPRAAIMRLIESHLPVATG